jgi:hypothetical protein
MPIKRKPKKQPTRKVEVEVGGKIYTLKFSSDIDQILSGLGIALLSLNDPKVNTILKQFGLEFYDVDGKKIGVGDEN